MEDLTDMQNHVLPYLQSFCNLEEKGVKERREQQIAERYEGRADERVTSTEANAVVKDVGKTDRKPAQQKQSVDGKDKKLSIHEWLEINKRIIQEKQGKDKPERGADSNEGCRESIPASFFMRKYGVNVIMNSRRKRYWISR